MTLETLFRVRSTSRDYKFATAPIFTAMHIHKARPPSMERLSSIARFTLDSLPPRARCLHAKPNSDRAGSIRFGCCILNDPSQFYFNVHTVDNGGGAMRGQLQKAQMAVFMV